MSKFCTNCGATLNDDARFCTECGATLEAAAAQPAAAAAPPPPPPQAAAPVMQAAPPPQAAPAAEKPKKKKKARPVYDDYDAPAPGSKYAPISTWGYIGISLLACIPIVGFILLIVWAFGGCKKINKRNFARAMLIMMAIGLVFSLISGCAMKMVFDKAVDAIEEESGISVSALMGKDNGKSGKNSKSDDKENSSGGLGDLGALAGLLGGSSDSGSKSGGSSKDNDDAANALGDLGALAGLLGGSSDSGSKSGGSSKDNDDAANALGDLGALAGLLGGGSGDGADLGSLLGGLAGAAGGSGGNATNQDIESLEDLSELLGGLEALQGGESSSGGLSEFAGNAADINREAEASNDGWPSSLRKYPGGKAKATASYRTEISDTTLEEMMGWIDDLKKDGFKYQDFYNFGMSEADMLGMNGWWAYDGKTYLSVSYADGTVIVDHTKELPDLSGLFG